MAIQGRKGFTLIELLVVIAIIGILAAMLFPVFARAREAARKTQCLSNVKNIAMAVQMYISDYDQFMPIGNQDKYAADYFDALAPGGLNGDKYSFPDNICNHVRQANPYAREDVILDEYIKNRDVWRCPSAGVLNYAECIVPASSTGNWVDAFKIDHPDWKSLPYEEAPRPCGLCWPSGWGGDVTDSFKQGWAQAEGQGVFAMGVGLNDNMHWERPSSVNDVARYIVVGDCGVNFDIWNSKTLALPDYGCSFNSCGTDPGCCGTIASAGPGGLTWDEKQAKVWRDATWRRAHARHMGGSNVGFADGHAKWETVESLIFQQQPYKDAIFEGGLDSSICDWTDNYCVNGQPNTG